MMKVNRRKEELKKRKPKEDLRKKKRKKMSMAMITNQKDHRMRIK